MRFCFFLVFAAVRFCQPLRLTPTVLDGICKEASKAVEDNSFVEMVASKFSRRGRNRGRKKSANDPSSFTNELCEIHGRMIQLKKKGPRIQLTYKYERQHKQSNLELSSFTSQFREDLLATDFEKVTLFTTSGDYTASSSSGVIVKAKPKFSTQFVSSHDIPKKTMNDPSSTFFQKLGVTDKDGKPRPRMSSKLRQCNKFVEVVGRLVLKGERVEERGVRVLDMGCGKGYLTFALHNHLSEKIPSAAVHSVGVEVRPKLVEDINNIASDLGGHFDTLKFTVGEIGNYNDGDDGGHDDDGENNDALNPISALIALHACDTATDDAIYQGIKNGADIIVLSPCCHKEVRRYMENVNYNAENHPYKHLLRYGVYRERVAEHVTDTIRGLLLEEAGYDVDIFEFIGGEHTAKNCMITATRSKKTKRSESKIDEIRNLAKIHGVKRMKLAELMKVDLGDLSGNIYVGGRMPK